MTENKKPSLLIVDDSKISRMLIKANIEKLRPDWHIIQAASGNESISLTESSTPDFITMDLNMPGMDGLEASKLIKERFPSIKIVMCTANFQDAVRDTASLGGLHFISKPVTDKNIQEAIDFFEE